jgi:hypothetical protein
MTGSKRVVHWTRETWCQWSEIAGSPQGSPQQPTPSVVKLEGGPAASVKLGQKSCVIKSAYTLSAQSQVKHPLKGDESTGLHIVSMEPSESPTERQRSQWSELRRAHQCSETMLTGESRFHISTPLGFWTRVPHDGKQTGSPLDQGVHWTRATWCEWKALDNIEMLNISCGQSYSCSVHSIT